MKKGVTEMSSLVYVFIIFLIVVAIIFLIYVAVSSREENLFDAAWDIFKGLPVNL